MQRRLFRINARNELCYTHYCVIFVSNSFLLYPVYLARSNNALAFACMEDAYLTLLDVDGVEWTTKLRKRMSDATLDASDNTAGETTTLI